MFLVLIGLLLCFLPSAKLQAGDDASGELERRRGDRICLIGNTLAERMQHDGWLETLLQSRFPGHRLVFRNLGFSGDEVARRQRSANFGSPDDHLARNRADVIFAFFGFNESFRGTRGLGEFQRDLDVFIRQTLEKKYNGESAPRLVLFSPIAHEDLEDLDLPDGSENNERLRLYTLAMAKVTKAHGVRFVDLFAPSRDLYRKSSRPLTINGIHLNEYGNRWIATVVERALLPSQPATSRDSRHLEKLRDAVVDKNSYWFNRYRSTDGFNVFGGRSALKFTDDISNFDVLQRRDGDPRRHDGQPRSSRLGSREG